eukprot:TRINITY_DN6546_c0_g1_i1.p1 TRINITY_DN6546_c0_g1~~TRINITY_DN6546_c0_g1_i1.p1  ORF type:complete len:580 (-),score=94.69 TRINITY_DN6546_c0_g1_i1:111-1850(-)
MTSVPQTSLVLRDSTAWSLVRCSSGSTAVVMFNPHEGQIALGTAHVPAAEDYEEHNYFSLLANTAKAEEANSTPRGVDEDAMNSGYCKKFFSTKKKLGMGADGAVFLVTHVINGVELGQYALKKVPVGDNYDWLKIGLREVKALEALRQHPNIIDYKHSWLEMDTLADFGPVVPCLHILMEFVDGGNLEDYVMAQELPLDVSEIWALFLDLTFGIDYLHSKGIIHRDIKGPNMLLSKVYDPDTGEFRRHKLMISDFGTAVFKKRVGGDTRTGHTGTPEWVPPEFIKRNGSLYEYDAHADIWGLGLILYFLAYSKLPWTISREHELLLNEEIVNGIPKLPTKPSRPIDMQRMIYALTNKNPSKRPSAREILLSPFIQNLIRTMEDPVQEELHQLLILESSRETRKKRKVPEIKALSLLQLPEDDIGPIPPSPSVPTIQPVQSSPSLQPLPSKTRRLSLPTTSSRPPKHAQKRFSRNLYTLLHLIVFSLKAANTLMVCSSEPSQIYIFGSVCLAAVALVFRDESQIFTGALLLEWFWSILLSSTGFLCPSQVLPILSTFIFVLQLTVNFNRSYFLSHAKNE